MLQAVLLAQFEMQRVPGEFRPEIDLPDDIVDRALQAWQAQQQVWRQGRHVCTAGLVLGRACCQ